jgi:hypothetical protein
MSAYDSKRTALLPCKISIDPGLFRIRQLDPDHRRYGLHLLTGFIMRTRWILNSVSAAFFWVALGSSAGAESDVAAKVQAALYAGHTAQAASSAQARLAEAPDDNVARFALGAVQFLQAVEHLGQALYRYGLKSSYQTTTAQLSGLTSLPILRLPVPPNHSPDKITYEEFRRILVAFVQDLQTADTTLSKIDNDNIDLPMNIGLIRLDLNNDGKGSDDETLWRMFEIVASAGWLDEKAAKQLLVDFDGSDVPWLRAYCHFLMAMSEFPLAYDWRHAFEVTFHNVFPSAELPYSAAFKNYQELLAELEKLGISPNPPVRFSREALDEWLKTPEGQKWKRLRSLKLQIQMGSIADLIVFVHLNHWPVIEPQRLRDVLDHLEAMARLSRDSWKRILAETDDHNEWIPNPKQTGVLPRMRVTNAIVEGWMLFLDEFEGVLDGKKLIPHWRFDQGINMRRFFLEPTTFDLVLLIQGSAALPYLQDGDLVTEQEWSRIANLFGGNFFQYFIWFN